jgi:hypothetical protein
VLLVATAVAGWALLPSQVWPGSSPRTKVLDERRARLAASASLDR